MTDKQVAVLQGLIDGKGYAEIGRELGMTRQNAFLTAKNAIKIRGVENAEYYPELRRYVSNNYKSIRDFCVNHGLCYQIVCNMLLRGSTPSFKTILRLREITGLSADDLMAKEPKDV